MTDRPLLFSAPMIQALLAGRKTQTRRIAKITAVMGNKVPVYPPEELIELSDGEFREGIVHYLSTGALSGPYAIGFAVGDRIWVKERCFIPPAHISERDLRDGADTWPKAIYAADDLEGGRDMVDRCQWRHRVSIHMPRWASRLTLTVTDVRVQRLQDCSEVDAIQEGVTLIEECLEDPIEAYAALWDSINTDPGKRWADNPWIVALTFDVEQRNIDA